MRLTLKSAPGKLVFALACLASTAAYILFVGREYLAARAEQQGNLARAVNFQPSNAEYHNRLGQLLAASGDFSAAQRHYDAALRLNPHVARYWLNQAMISQRNGDPAAQQRAIEKAVEVDPRTPEVAWQAANFYLVQGQTDKALQHFRTVLEGSQDLAPAVLDLAWRATHDVDRLLARTIPPDPAVYFAMMDVLGAYHELPATEKAWDSLVHLRQPFDVRRGLAYVNYLIEQKQIPRAVSAWDQMTSLNRMPAYLPSENLVVNGGFDSEILNGGFDWQYLRQPNVELSLDDTVFHGGHRALQIIFRGPAVDDVKLSHLVPVAPNKTYDFSGYFKTGQIEGAGGPRLTIVDAYTGQPYFTSDDLKNAEVWRQVEGTFTTGPDAQLAVVKILRVPEGHPIRGNLWLDDLQLVTK